jgi:hypothetical protein
MDDTHIPGYEFGSASLPRSPVSLDELRALEQACGFNNNAREQLRKAAGVLMRHAENLVDKWRSAVAEHAEMRQVFFGPDGQPDETYKAAVRKRFVRWVTIVVNASTIRTGSITKKKSVGATHLLRRIVQTLLKRLVSYRSVT